MVWLNYEFAWGGTYQNYYKEQSLNGIVIDKDELQPLKFQGQYYDPETSLHYNRFRYYDSDVGMFIQRDPIGLLDGLNTFQYTPNPILWVDPWGLATLWGQGKTYYYFNDWFDNATNKEVAKTMKNPTIRDEIKDALRGTGGKHEWFPVSMAAKAKKLGFTAQELKTMSSPTEDVYFINIPDPSNSNNLLQGPHPSSADTNNTASAKAHDLLKDTLKKSRTKSGAIARIKDFIKNYTNGSCSI